MSGWILTVNAGSSSIKFAVFSCEAEALDLIVRGQVDGIGTAPRFVAKDYDGAHLNESVWEPVPEGQGHAVALGKIVDWLGRFAHGERLLAVGHRFVHGGPEYGAPVVIDETVLAELQRLVPLVPLHQPHNLAAVRAVAQTRPDLPQIACFDTAFHQNRALVSHQFGLPAELYESGIRRYGFHGISYEYITRCLGELDPAMGEGRVVIAHLGSGCSLCAVRAGRSVETTMSFSALDGLPMGTRCGALDPGVLLYLMRNRGMDATALEDLLYKRSGLLGISGLSNDLRVLEQSEDPRAAEAIDYFVYRIGQSLGSMVAALGGLDALVFTAGVGENSPLIRRRVCEDAGWLGVGIDHDRNERAERRLSPDGVTPSVWVIPTDEERMIALHTQGLVPGT
jgi:acetate kinase